MSVTYDIACTECKKCLWIAQSSYCLYIGEKNTMKALEDFLFKHYGHPLVFADRDLFDEFEEIDADTYKESTDPIHSI